MEPKSAEQIFWSLIRADSEQEVDSVIVSEALFEDPSNWVPYGDLESNYAVVENQQSSAVGALVEKVVNSIDAILMRKCSEQKIDPRCPDAPRTIDAAVEQFFPDNKGWDLAKARRKQSQDIQILASGKKLQPCLLIYDNGEGQEPEAFPETFLSMLKGNKSEIHFVQGRYNMGGSGALVFCGKKRYQLVASARASGSGYLGFTLVRKHPMSETERLTKRNTWYEYFCPGGKIPKFLMSGPVDVGLVERGFQSGALIKLYDYGLPEGSRSVISKDLHQSINEFLFQPALPLLTVDNAKRYPKERYLQRELFGLRRRLEANEGNVLQEFFSIEASDDVFGSFKATCYVFNIRAEGKDAKETKKSIQDEYFKNRMVVTLTVNGQVHGSYGSEFVTRQLKLRLLKEYLLIAVDCTNINAEYRNELFMASRDRLREGEESASFRKWLCDELLSDRRLTELEKQRKASFDLDSTNTSELIKRFTKNLPWKTDLMKLIKQSMKTPAKAEPKVASGQPRKERSGGPGAKRENFSPKRYPSSFALKSKPDASPYFQIPVGGNRSVTFETDVEDNYFDRTEDAGQLTITVLRPGQTGKSGGTKSLPSVPDSTINVSKSSPEKGRIRLNLKPNSTAQVGDTFDIRAELSGAGDSFHQYLLVKIVDSSSTEGPEAAPEPSSDEAGLPKLHLVYQESGAPDSSPRLTWEQVGGMASFDHATIFHPSLQGDELEAIFINMSSSVALNNRNRAKGEEAIMVADNKYVASVYFHVIFLYSITQASNYSVSLNNQDDPDLVEYLKTIFSSAYAEFLVNFGTEALMAAID